MTTPRASGRQRTRLPPRAPGPLSRWEFRETDDVRDVLLDRRAVCRTLAPLGVTGNDAKVAWLVASLYKSAQIAGALGVSRSTVTAAIGRLLRRFGLRERGELLRRVRSLVKAAEPPGGIL